MLVKYEELLEDHETVLESITNFIDFPEILEQSLDEVGIASWITLKIIFSFILKFWKWLIA